MSYSVQFFLAMKAGIQVTLLLLIYNDKSFMNTQFVQVFKIRLLYFT